MFSEQHSKLTDQRPESAAASTLDHLWNYTMSRHNLWLCCGDRSAILGCRYGRRIRRCELEEMTSSCKEQSRTSHLNDLMITLSGCMKPLTCMHSESSRGKSLPENVRMKVYAFHFYCKFKLMQYNLNETKKAAYFNY